MSSELPEHGTPAASQASSGPTTTTKCVCGLILLAVAGGILWFRGQSDDFVPPEPAAELTVAPYKIPSTDDYTGSQACTECHTGIARTYQTHPMARSITLIDPEAIEGQLPLPRRQVPGHRRFFEVDVHEGIMRHHEKMLAADGSPIYGQAVPMDYVVGSGTRAKAYLYHRGELLFMSPLNWYSQRQVWDLAPGYVPDDERRFDRQATDECLSCHAGRPSVPGRADNRFRRPAFHEMAIGCENCHGPGRNHIRFHKQQLATPPDSDPIVNPGKLAPELRESVCNQCHHQAAARILRHGRSHFDFRPGMHADDIWTFMDGSSRMGQQGQLTAVSHVQQMRRSRCFQKSDGQLGCISCHDPHRTPQAQERIRFYRTRCLNCHAQNSCLAPLEQREAQQDSCIACHMPARDSSNVSHVSQTDHRVIRSRSSAPAEVRTPAQLALPDSAAHLPLWERDRAWGLGNWSYLDLNSVDPGREVTSRILDISKSGPADGAVLDTLGLMALRYQRYRSARPFFERSLAFPDAAFSAWNNLLNLSYQASEFEIALDYANQILKTDPGSSRVLTLKADILANLGRRNEAIRVGEEALRLNPSLEPLRVWLIVQLEQAGRKSEQQEHEQILQRMQTPTLPPAATDGSSARQTSDSE